MRLVTIGKSGVLPNKTNLANSCPEPQLRTGNRDDLGRAGGGFKHLARLQNMYSTTPGTRNATRSLSRETCVTAAKAPSLPLGRAELVRDGEALHVRYFKS